MPTFQKNRVRDANPYSGSIDPPPYQRALSSELSLPSFRGNNTYQEALSNILHSRYSSTDRNSIPKYEHLDSVPSPNITIKSGNMRFMIPPRKHPFTPTDTTPTSSRVPRNASSRVTFDSSSHDLDSPLESGRDYFCGATYEEEPSGPSYNLYPLKEWIETSGNQDPSSSDFVHHTLPDSQVSQELSVTSKGRHQHGHSLEPKVRTVAELAKSSAFGFTGQKGILKAVPSPNLPPLYHQEGMLDLATYIASRHPSPMDHTQAQVDVTSHHLAVIAPSFGEMNTSNIISACLDSPRHLNSTDSRMNHHNGYSFTPEMQPYNDGDGSKDSAIDQAVTPRGFPKHKSASELVAYWESMQGSSDANNATPAKQGLPHRPWAEFTTVSPDSRGSTNRTNFGKAPEEKLYPVAEHISVPSDNKFDSAAMSSVMGNLNRTRAWLRDLIKQPQPYKTKFTELQRKDSMHERLLDDYDSTYPRSLLRKSTAGASIDMKFRSTVNNLENLLNETMELAAATAQREVDHQCPDYYELDELAYCNVPTPPGVHKSFSSENGSMVNEVGDFDYWTAVESALGIDHSSENNIRKPKHYRSAPGMRGRNVAVKIPKRTSSLMKPRIKPSCSTLGGPRYEELGGEPPAQGPAPGPTGLRTKQSSRLEIPGSPSVSTDSPPTSGCLPRVASRLRSYRSFGAIRPLRHISSLRPQADGAMDTPGDESDSTVYQGLDGPATSARGRSQQFQAASWTYGDDSRGLGEGELRDAPDTRIDLRGRSHVSLRGYQGFSLARAYRRQPVARDWSTARKRFVAGVACLSTAFIGMVIGIYAGLVPSIQYWIADLNHYAILGNFFFYLGLAIPTFFFWPLPLLHGRKPYILSSLILAMPLLFPQAIAVSTWRSPYVSTWRWALLGSRGFMGLTLGFASMNFHSMLTDLFGASLMSGNPHQEVVDKFDVRRHGGGMGVWLGLWTWCFTGSIGIGFLIGAAIINNFNPSWGFYVSIMMIAVVLLLNVICPEVRRSPFRRSVAELKDGKQFTWTSHLLRRAIFLTLLPILGMAYTVSSAGGHIPVPVPVLFATLMGTLSALAVAECNGLIMENFDCSDLLPGMIGRPRGYSNKQPKRTNYSSHPRIAAGFAVCHTFGFLLAALATTVAGRAQRNLGQREATGIVAGVLFLLTVLLLAVLVRFKEIEIIPSSKTVEMEKWQKIRRESIRKSIIEIKAGRPLPVTMTDEEIWRPRLPGNPSSQFRRVNILELGAMTRWTEIRKKNKLIDESAAHLNRAALESARLAVENATGIGARTTNIIRKVSSRKGRRKQGQSQRTMYKRRGVPLQPEEAGPSRGDTASPNRFGLYRFDAEPARAGKQTPTLTVPPGSDGFSFKAHSDLDTGSVLERPVPEEDEDMVDFVTSSEEDGNDRIELDELGPMEGSSSGHARKEV
ncbi:hypothetical protein GE21DRAFT_7434 [Neurospora crassa]|uniref:Polyamine transport protein n=2 Tax=Neurospora crassa TaxID=5141 RepID=Q1K8D8_NEUCR|nr:hypothetical protein NCU01009 [Neurospora crassa OR74A]EAA32385.3 hypothetical protein NCU01009 [Neurospora crassa OR74A]KHE88377.1 hypothetical protein GE21DRAFT_7434 [Neurospora crassa]CAD70825.1 related to Polyamine transport protein [Neurospora crassa]|eukprot:XP_961621.3 hypothetical protein NCU01009 [Neurospora crassa OR74A]